MPDERPRPQYGEYASPEQQAAAMGKRPIPPLRVFPEIPPKSGPQQQPQPPTQSPAPPSSAHPSTAEPSSAPNAEDRVRLIAPPTGHPIDRIVTYVLLGIGVFTLIDSIPGYLTFASTLNQTGRMLGVTFPSAGSVSVAGYLVLAAHAVLLAATMIISVRFARRGRLAFYLPIVGYLVFDVALLVILATAIPGFFDVVTRSAALS